MGENLSLQDASALQYACLCNSHEKTQRYP